MLQWKPKGKKGFSLIELLVVVGIIGILSAIAIPAYNRYRSNAARGAFDATGTNVVRAFQACIAANTFVNCDELEDIGITVAMSNDGSMSPFFCVDMEADIGGTNFKGCYSVNAQTGGVTSAFSQAICYQDAASTQMHDGINCGTGAGFTTNSAMGAFDPCDTQAAPLTLCDSGNADCVGAGVGDICGTAQTAACGATTGRCI